MVSGLSEIDHVVVLMLENRSFDNLLGYLYTDQGNRPPINIPDRDPTTCDGLPNSDAWCPYDSGKYPTVRGTSHFRVPNPDPNERFCHMTNQLFQTPRPALKQVATMRGFIDDYASAKHNTPGNVLSIMECYDPHRQVPVLAALASSFAVSDRWFAASPTQTWPNRSFMHSGTACGHVNNTPKDTVIPYLDWDAKTIYNAMEEKGVDWAVYYSHWIPDTCLTRLQMNRLHPSSLDSHFRRVEKDLLHPNDSFYEACALGELPAYSFVEPSWVPEFGEFATSEHPPADIRYGERFLWRIWDAVSNSPKWDRILLVVTFDEHGGCYDHVRPPGAVSPDDQTGSSGFRFNRFGVRIPTVLIANNIRPGTVFRADGDFPYDHTSILATVMKWQPGLSVEDLASKRIHHAPTFENVLTAGYRRAELPTIPEPPEPVFEGDLENEPLTNLQSTVIAAAMLRRMGSDRTDEVRAAMENIRTQKDAADLLESWRGE